MLLYARTSKAKRLGNDFVLQELVDENTTHEIVGFGFIAQRDRCRCHGLTANAGAARHRRMSGPIVSNCRGKWRELPARRIRDWEEGRTTGGGGPAKSSSTRT